MRVEQGMRFDKRIAFGPEGVQEAINVFAGLYPEGYNVAITFAGLLPFDPRTKKLVTASPNGQPNITMMPCFLVWCLVQGSEESFGALVKQEAEKMIAASQGQQDVLTGTPDLSLVPPSIDAEPA